MKFKKVQAGIREVRIPRPPEFATGNANKFCIQYMTDAHQKCSSVALPPFCT